MPRIPTTCRWSLLLALTLAAPTARAQLDLVDERPPVPTVAPAAPADMITPVDARMPPDATTADDTNALPDIAATLLASEPTDLRLVPEMSAAARTWIAVVLLLLALLRLRPLVALHNVDALVLAGLAVLLLWRGDDLHTAPAWTAGAFAAAAGYWLLRGLGLLRLRPAAPRLRNLSTSATLVLMAAGLLFAFDALLRAPLTAGARDGLVGGVHVVQSGRLPHGALSGHDARSPLLYGLYAGAVTAWDVTQPTGERLATIAGPTLLITDDTLAPAATRVALLVNVALLVALLAGLWVLGARLHSRALSAALVGVFCLFPGAHECMAHPEVMLPAALITWSLALAVIGGLGGLLATVLAVAAGVAWPWAWLALPVLVAYLLRRGWQALAALAALAGTAAAAVACIAMLTEPRLPRLDGAVAAAGLVPEFTARVLPDGQLVVDRLTPTPEPPPAGLAARQWFWRHLLNRDALTFDGGGHGGLVPHGTDVSRELYRSVPADGHAREYLAEVYRATLEQSPDTTRTWAAIRTVLEATWLPAERPLPRQVSTWDVWTLHGDPATWLWMRRAAKLLAVLIVLAVSLRLVSRAGNQPPQLVGAFLVAGAAALLVSQQGPATDWAWLLPLALAATVAHGMPPQRRRNGHALPVRPPLPPFMPDAGPAPRITVAD